MTDLLAYLRQRPYPGRGILLGNTPSGRNVCAYFIMGRSENSRNRVFEKTEDGIRTKAFDESRMVDPSLIIYHPVRRCGDALVVTNGDQTDTIRDFLSHGKTWMDALNTRRFEPDAPNWTPRISGIQWPNGAHMLSILKAQHENADICQRFFYAYELAQGGTGHFISTYEGFGSPLPSFSGEPVAVRLPEADTRELAAGLWDAMNADNKVSLYVCVHGEELILNKNA